MKRNGETVEYQVTLNIPDLRKKINKTCANRPVSCVNGEKPSDFGSPFGLSHRESPWQAGQLPTGRLSPDMAQKGGPCYRGQRLLDKRTLSSCRESWQRSTTVSEKIRLCSFRVGLTDTPEALPLGELSPKVTERARTPTESLSAPFCSKNFLKIHFIGLLFCYTPVRTKRYRREEE